MPSKWILIGKGFDVTCKEGSVRIIGIKSKAEATIDQLNEALENLPKIEGIVMDGSNISGRIKDLKVKEPDRLKRLHMRWCNVEADLKDLQKYHFEALKLSGRKINGKLEDLHWDRLKFLDLRDAKSVTGDLSHMAYPEKAPLTGLWLQGTSASGNIVQLLKSNPRMAYLHLGESQISGIFKDEWEEEHGGIGKQLKELFLQHTEVKFQMTSPTVVSDMNNMTVPFPHLSRLDVSGSALDMDVWDFLHPLAYTYVLSSVLASGCGLYGQLKGVHAANNRPLYWQLKVLDVSKNNITALEGLPSPSTNLDASGNPHLEEIEPSYFKQLNSLNIRHTGYIIMAREAGDF